MIALEGSHERFSNAIGLGRFHGDTALGSTRRSGILGGWERRSTADGGMSVNEQLAGDSDKDDFGRLAGVLEALHEAEKGFTGARGAQGAPVSVLRRRSLPTRLILPRLRTDEPELCSLGERPAKAAKPWSCWPPVLWTTDHPPSGDGGVKSAILGSSASRMVAEISQKTSDGAQQTQMEGKRGIGGDDTASRIHDGLALFIEPSDMGRDRGRDGGSRQRRTSDG
jgi:hypothetical protein